MDMVWYHMGPILSVNVPPHGLACDLETDQHDTDTHMARLGCESVALLEGIGIE